MILNSETEQPSQHQSQDNPHLMLTPEGVFVAFAQDKPSEEALSLQALLANKRSWLVRDWTDEYGHEWLETFIDKGWVQRINQGITAPNLPLDQFLPYVVASLSGSRRAAIGNTEGFCLARVGYSQQEADTLCVAGADLGEFLNRQRQRGWVIQEQAVSFFCHVDLLLPATSFMFLWIDGNGFILVLEDEPLTNSRAFVELIWAIKTSGLRFVQE